MGLDNLNEQPPRNEPSPEISQATGEIDEVLELYKRHEVFLKTDLIFLSTLGLTPEIENPKVKKQIDLALQNLTALITQEFNNRQIINPYTEKLEAVLRTIEECVKNGRWSELSKQTAKLVRLTSFDYK